MAIGPDDERVARAGLERVEDAIVVQPVDLDRRPDLLHGGPHRLGIGAGHQHDQSVAEALPEALNGRPSFDPVRPVRTKHARYRGPGQPGSHREPAGVAGGCGQRRVDVPERLGQLPRVDGAPRPGIGDRLVEQPAPPSQLFVVVRREEPHGRRR